ncbi:MAG: methionyl-tRNA formyltransferase [Anaerolineaceae bacterium]|nr:methionyl-tRNA formyltransferase [Anaerolineaceae bacterium]
MSRRCVFMGSPDFSLPVLSALAENYTICGVFTQPDRPAGRGMKLTAPPVKILANSLGITVYQPEKLKDDGNYELLKKLDPDFIVVAAYGQILRTNILTLPKFGCINVHASLLPRWRGASPIQAAIAAGDKKTGITIMKMDIGMDTGDIIAQKEINISAAHTGGTLFDELAQLGADFLIETLPKYLSGTLIPSTQPDEGITSASLIHKQDGKLDLVTCSAVEIERKVRAFNPWPGTYLEWNDIRLKVIEADVIDDASSKPEKRIESDGWPMIGTKSGWLRLISVQPAGKKKIDGKQFLNGARGWL